MTVVIEPRNPNRESYLTDRRLIFPLRHRTIES
jgi:hypothetical protein